MKAPARLRVLVVDDSVSQRHLISRILSKDPGIELVGSASNGAEAVRAAAHLRPDVITLDDRMPVMNGLEAARQIMRETPTPIVMISAATGEDARRLTDEALAAGVLAVQGKRALQSAEPGVVSELVRVIKCMAQVRVVRRRREIDHALEPIKIAERPDPLGNSPEVVAIGASTGGPQVLRQILARLPASFSLPVLVVQHTTAGYSNTLVEWLNTATRLQVRIAETGQSIDQRGVFIAQSGRHLVVQGRRLALIDDAPVSLHRPSATVLFRSVAEHYRARSIGVLLTGMGDDGARGLAEMRQAGGLTIAQDEASSVVFGMPAEAIRLGAAEHVLPPDHIASVLIEQSLQTDGVLWN